MSDIIARLQNDSFVPFEIVRKTYKVLVLLANDGNTAILRKLRDRYETHIEPVSFSPEEKQLLSSIENGECLLVSDSVTEGSIRNVILSAIKTNGECYILHNPVKNPLSEFWFI